MSKDKKYYQGYANGLGEGLGVISKLIDEGMGMDELLYSFNELTVRQQQAMSIAMESKDDSQITAELIGELIKHVTKERF